MTDEWRRYEVSDLIDQEALEIGDGYRATNAELSPAGLPFARARNIGNGFWFSGSDVDYVPEDAASKLGKKVSRPGDVVFTSKGTVGRCAFVKHDTPRFVYSPQLCYWRSRDEDLIDPRFLYYWMASQEFRTQVYSVSGQTDMAEYVSLGDQRRMHLTAPPVAEQRAIGHVLGALDDKIDLNRRMNATLEAMARALFTSWFVDFDPVRAKMEGHDTGLSAHIAALFPDHLVDSGSGAIPYGWETSEIGKEVKVVGGATPSTKEPSYWDLGTHHWATPKDLSALSSPVLLETNRKITAAGVKKIASGVLPVGTVLLSSRAPIGYLAIAAVPVAVNQGFIAMVCERRVPNLYVLFWCYRNLDYVRSIASGTTFAEISKRAFRPLPVIVPPAPLLTAWTDLVRPLYDRMVTSARQCESLTGMRDLLLPRLMSGGIRIADAGRAGGRLG